MLVLWPDVGELGGVSSLLVVATAESLWVWGRSRGSLLSMNSESRITARFSWGIHGFSLVIFWGSGGVLFIFHVGDLVSVSVFLILYLGLVFVSRTLLLVNLF